MKGGIFERFHSMPIDRSAVLWAHVQTSLVANPISVVVVVLVALLMGFRSAAGVPAWLAVAGILTLFTLVLTWIAVIPGLSAKSADGASAFAYPILFRPFVSSAFVPTDTMPRPVRAFAEHQPVTSIVNAIRDLLTQRPVGTDLDRHRLACLHSRRRVQLRHGHLSPPNLLEHVIRPLATTSRMSWARSVPRTVPKPFEWHDAVAWWGRQTR